MSERTLNASSCCALAAFAQVSASIPCEAEVLSLFSSEKLTDAAFVIGVPKVRTSGCNRISVSSDASEKAIKVALLKEYVLSRQWNASVFRLPTQRIN